MRTREIPLALAAALAVVIAGCAAHRSRPNRAPSALEPVNSDDIQFNLRPVAVPPSGYPGSAMSTDDNNRARQGYPSYQKAPIRNSPEAQKTASEDQIVYPAAAPVKILRLPSRMKPGKKMAAVKRRNIKRYTTKVAHTRRSLRPQKIGLAYAPAPSPFTIRLREVEALNRLHHLNQSEIALANLALEHSPSSTTLAMAQQTKDEHQLMEKRVAETAKRMNIKLENYSPATYEVAVTNELLRGDGRFEISLHTAMNHARKDAAHDLAVANTEMLQNHEVIALINAEKPLLAANRFVPAHYRDEAIAREGESDLGQ